MRPRALDEFVGQDHLVGERGPLRRSVARGHLASLLLWGPPGTGKTSLARLLAGEIGAHFSTISAVMAGVADVRALIAEAQDRIALHGTRTVLFLDEIHRFNKAQQDALLPHVEDGTITLVGATTENPYSADQLPRVFRGHHGKSSSGRAPRHALQHAGRLSAESRAETSFSAVGSNELVAILIS